MMASIIIDMRGQGANFSADISVIVAVISPAADLAEEAKSA